MNANGRVISIFLMQEAPPQEPTPVPGKTATPPPKPKEDHWWQLGSWGLGERLGGAVAEVHIWERDRDCCFFVGCICSSILSSILYNPFSRLATRAPHTAQQDQAANGEASTEKATAPAPAPAGKPAVAKTLAQFFNEAKTTEPEAAAEKQEKQAKAKRGDEDGGAVHCMTAVTVHVTVSLCYILISVFNTFRNM